MIRFALIMLLAVCSFKTSNLVANEPPVMIEITDENSQKTFDTAHLLVVDVYAPWCGPCKRLAPIIDELNAEYGTLYQFAKVNGDSNAAFLEKYKIEAFPTILFIKDGKEVGRHEGFLSKERLLEKIKGNLS